jgi:antitoxin HicB
MQFIYPYTVLQSEDGAWQVRFPDVPEALTEGDTEAEAHALATDASLAALGGLVKMKRDVPESSAADAGPVVVVPMLGFARLALCQAMRGEGLNTVTLARKLGLVEGEVRRMLDLDHQTRIGTLEKALWQLGKQVTSGVGRAA